MRYVPSILSVVLLAGCANYNSKTELASPVAPVCPTYKHGFMSMDYGCEADIVEYYGKSRLAKPFDPERYSLCVADRARADLDCKLGVETKSITNALHQNLSLLGKATFENLKASFDKNPAYKKHSQELALSQFARAYNEKALDVIGESLAQVKQVSQEGLDRANRDLFLWNAALAAQPSSQNVTVINNQSSQPQYPQAVVPAPRRPVTTNCMTMGVGVNCVTY